MVLLSGVPLEPAASGRVLIGMMGVYVALGRLLQGTTVVLVVLPP